MEPLKNIDDSKKMQTILDVLIQRIKQLEKEKIRGEMRKEKRVAVKFDIERAIVIADQVQDFFKENKIEPMDALLSMMILSEAVKRYLNLLPEDYNRLLEALEKAK
jgi:hypothetical protein